ncbi:MAG: AarF/UbiB family protein, partial [Kiritimatiellae bacterium]|nr:AarF/UbiB family protein [Kiritimatiellia bacterium]
DEMDRLAALVKGAGPVFLKMVQGIPEGAIPKDMEKLRKLLGDVKDKLPPMPDRVIKAQLLDMVVRSNKKILGIDVVKTLGAASVGQALLCRVRTAANPDGEECVIKLLRPDAQNAVRRELAFFKGEMAKVSGMDKTFQGRLDSILDELDLTKEATNVEFGQVYAVGGTGRVSSMELHSIIRPTESSMVVKKARGVTCDKYFRRVDDQMDAILKNLREEVEVEMPGGGKRKVVRYTASNMTEYNAQRDKLHKLYQQTLDRQRDLAEMTRRWADETLFGTGFFHGDLHAGNIMVDENGVTLIDYGNAIKPTDDQRKWLVMMLSLCSYGNHADFMKQLGTVPNDKWKALAADLQTAFGKGTMNDSGLRIAAAVSILQRHGVEVPSILYNFSQSMLRLQGALNLANDTLLKLKAVFQNVGMKQKGMGVDAVELEDPFDLRSSSILDLFGTGMDAKYMREMYKDRVEKAFALPANFKAGVEGFKSTYDKLVDLCQSKESIQGKLLPLLAKHAMFHTVSRSKNASPDSRDECGMRAYHLAEQMLDDSFDLSDKEMLRERLVKIANLIKERALAAFDNARKLEHPDFSDFTTFSNIFYDCIDDKRPEITKIMLWYAFDKGKIEASLKVAENEQVAQKTNITASINKNFGIGHEEFSPVTIQKISALVRDEFVFSVKVFSADWFKSDNGNTAKQMARMLLSNAVRVKQLLVREEGYKPEEDVGGVYLKRALDLAFGHYATQHGSSQLTLFDLFRSANAEKYFYPWKAGFKNMDSVEQPGRKISQGEQEMLTYVCDLFYTKDEDSLEFIPNWKDDKKAA